MALADTVFGRLKVYFLRRFPNRKVDGPKQKLGADSLGFDDIAIQGKLRDDFNSNEFGFADMLTNRIPRTEFDESSSLGDVRDFILENTDINSLDAYRIKMNERVRLSLRGTIARLTKPPADPKDLLPTDNVSKWIPTADLPRLAARLNEDLAKYLFRDVRVSELSSLLASIQDRIVARTII